MFLKSKWGFTLLELLIVVLIIGVLTAIVFPYYQGAMDVSRVRILQQYMHDVGQASYRTSLIYGSYDFPITAIDIDFLGKNGKLCSELVNSNDQQCEITGIYPWLKSSTNIFKYKTYGTLVIIHYGQLFWKMNYYPTSGKFQLWCSPGGSNLSDRSRCIQAALAMGGSNEKNSDKTLYDIP